MSQNYNIIITSGTSPGPYTIYYNQVSATTIASIYGLTLPATGVTLNQLTSGFYVTVPDGTTSIIVYNTYCDTKVTLAVSDARKDYDFCLTFAGDLQIHFVPSENYQNYPAWISDSSTDGNDYSVIWDSNLNQWRVSGDTLYLDCELLSTSPYPPLSGWYSLGEGCGKPIVYEGGCVSINSVVNFNYSVTQPTCVCDGTLTITPTSGVGPFTASIDGGVTFGGMIYTNLCSGTYSIVVKDSNDVISETQTVILNTSPSPTTYTLTYSTLVTTLSSTPTSTTKSYVTTFSVSPALPVGATVNFDISHFNLLKSSPTPTSATRVTNSTLLVNGSPVSLSSSASTPSTTVSTVPGCQGNTIFMTGLTETWQNITMGPTTTVQLTTVTSLNYTKNVCVVGESTETYSVNNLEINGCSCCEITITG